MFVELLLVFMLNLVFAALRGMKSAVHLKCRGGRYPFTDISRLVFPDELVPWNVTFKGYNPSEYTSPSLNGKPYADPDSSNLKFLWSLHVSL